MSEAEASFAADVDAAAAGFVAALPSWLRHMTPNTQHGLQGRVAWQHVARRVPALKQWVDLVLHGASGAEVAAASFRLGSFMDRMDRMGIAVSVDCWHVRFYWTRPEVLAALLLVHATSTDEDPAVAQVGRAIPGWLPHLVAPTENEDPCSKVMVPWHRVQAACPRLFESWLSCVGSEGREGHDAASVLASSSPWTQMADRLRAAYGVDATTWTTADHFCMAFRDPDRVRALLAL